MLSGFVLRIALAGAWKLFDVKVKEVPLGLLISEDFFLTIPNIVVLYTA